MKNLNPKHLNIVVFGSGYLGFEISQKLKKKGHSVLIVTRTKKNIKKNYIYKKCTKHFQNILKNKDIVICANGPLNEFNDVNKSKKIIKEYTFLIKSIFRESINQKIKKFIYLSSIHSLLKKNKTDDPKMFYYAQSKKKIEKELLKMSKNNKINLNILRLTNIFGYFSQKNFVKSKSVINNFIEQSKIKKEIVILSKENFERIFYPVSIFLEHIVFLTDNHIGRKILNIGNKTYCYSILEIAKKIKRFFFLKKKIRIKIHHNFSIRKRKHNIKRFKYFINPNIKENKLYFNSELQKMI